MKSINLVDIARFHQKDGLLYSRIAKKNKSCSITVKDTLLYAYLIMIPLREFDVILGWTCFQNTMWLLNIELRR